MTKLEIRNSKLATPDSHGVLVGDFTDLHVWKLRRGDGCRVEKLKAK